MVGIVGIEPTRLSALEFEARASTNSAISRNLVAREGIEPSWSKDRQILSLLRIPIPPTSHKLSQIIGLPTGRCRQRLPVSPGL